jgi:hypothetical protein
MRRTMSKLDQGLAAADLPLTEHRRGNTPRERLVRVRAEDSLDHFQP